jgi:FkbM family methyltransferase
VKLIHSLRRFITGVRRNLNYSNGWQICFDRIFRPDAKLAHFIWQGRYYFVVDPSVRDHLSLHEVFNARVYDPYLAACLLPGREIRYVNVGANVGAFDVKLLEFGFRIKAGVAAELNPYTFERCQVNFHANAVPTKLINVGVAGAAATIDFRPSPGSLSDSIYAPAGAPSERAVPVRLLTLDSLLAGHTEGESEFDLIKLDCEGAEYPILRQTPVEVLRRFRYLIVEFHREPSGESLAAASEALHAAGFVGRYRGPRNLPFVDFFTRSG